ncbi:MAG: S41 family peptidase [Gemmatimonadetes bacterium]|jgi:carboxyl-terminal processing protease|nr:S41 family peptidase [Gemmatimonadota bacterium]MBT6145936.1 S41 family peptidase [Gemmatimonadota bacterium]MBT7864549.1 S41 family peptidase [Gemmatimonadota bacterium]
MSDTSRRLRSSLATVVLTLIAPFVCSAANTDNDPYEKINLSWERFGAVYGRVIEHYYQDVDHDQIMRSAIDGLLRDLDPYSQFFDAEGLRQLRQDTTGKFAGLGITVGIKDHYPVIIAPIEATPASRAGLLPGDLIVAIEGRDTFDLGLEEIVTRLRGDPGSPVRITMSRRGVEDDWVVEITRELITIRSVAASGEMAPGVGYISMRQTRFSEDTSQEVADAISQLRAAGIHGLILDLRGNPGGLLSQATQVADLFLAKGAPIVSVRERARDREDLKVSQHTPLFGDLPLVVLIDGGSASAAEIVAGALQDNDRALLVGSTSFGKGSVQTIFDLRDLEQAALKLTTALYYTPSGRSIHRASLTVPPGALLQVPAGDYDLPAGLLLGLILRSPDAATAIERLQARFELEESEARQVLTTPLDAFIGEATDRDRARLAAPSDTTTFHTLRGRVVYGKGGIDPDLTVTTAAVPPIIQRMYRQRVFFDFIVDHMGLPQGQVDEPEIDDAMLEAFRRYLPTSAMARDGQPDGQEEIDHLRRLAADAGWNGGVHHALDSLQAAMDRKEEFIAFSDAALPHIRAALQRELTLRLRGREASLMASLEYDNPAQEALELLNDPSRYQQLLQIGRVDD